MFVTTQKKRAVSPGQLALSWTLGTSQDTGMFLPSGEALGIRA